MRDVIAFISVVSMACGASTAGAPSYPEKTIRIVSPFTPGGGTDLMARLIGQQFTRS